MDEQGQPAHPDMQMPEVLDVYGRCKPVYIPKGWGSELWFANSTHPDYCGKILRMDAAKRNSWHYHVTKDETLFVFQGEVLYRRARPAAPEDRELTHCVDTVLREGDAVFIPAGVAHQMIAVRDSVILEASLADVPGDTVRLVAGDTLPEEPYSGTYA